MLKKPVYRAVRLGEAANDLIEAKQVMSQMVSTDVFQALSSRQKRQYHIVLNLLRNLIDDISQDAGQEQLAS